MVAPTKVAFIQSLRDSDDRVLPEVVVEAARPTGSPIHDDFEWDDSVASHQYRIAQARRLITQIEVVIKTTTKEVTSVGYVHDPSLPPKQPGYLHVETVRNSDDMSRMVLEQELAAIEALVLRCYNIASALEMEEYVDTRLTSMFCH